MPLNKETKPVVEFRVNTIRKSLNPLITQAISYMVPLLSFYKDGFSIKLPTKVDVPLKRMWLCLIYIAFVHTFLVILIKINVNFKSVDILFTHQIKKN